MTPGPTNPQDNFIQEAVRKLMKEYRNAYSEILDEEVLAKGIPWFESFLRKALEAQKSHIKETLLAGMAGEDRKEYDGNNLSSACDAYGIAAESWSEIIRYEDGYSTARKEDRALINNILGTETEKAQAREEDWVEKLERFWWEEMVCIEHDSIDHYVDCKHAEMNLRPKIESFIRSILSSHTQSLKAEWKEELVGRAKEDAEYLRAECYEEGAGVSGDGLFLDDIIRIAKEL